jgi:hypothetical protein
MTLLFLLAFLLGFSAVYISHHQGTPLLPLLMGAGLLAQH